MIKEEIYRNSVALAIGIRDIRPLLEEKKESQIDGR